MSRIIISIIICLLMSCNPLRHLKQETPTQIAASRIMFVVMPMKEVGIPLCSFFGVCDSVLKKANIAKTAVTLSPDDFDESKHITDPISKPIRQFKPDCIILFTPQKLERNRGLNFVRYDTFILPIDMADFLFIGDTSSKKFNPTYISAVKLTAIGSSLRDKKNGSQAAEKFMDNLKKYITTLN